MRTARFLTVAAILSLCFSLGCGPRKIVKVVTDSPRKDEIMSGASAICIVDKTNPVLSATTGASRIAELLELGLRAKGYAINSDCDDNSIKIIANVLKYSSTEGSYERPGFSTSAIVSVRIASIKFNVDIYDKDELLFSSVVGRDYKSTAEELAGSLVMELLKKVPDRRTAQN
jgi:hypothetical protein